MRMSRPLSLRTDEFNYTLQILLAAVVGVLAAIGNLGFRALIEFFTWVFLGLEWRALEIERGGLRLGLVPVVLLSGGVGMVLLNWLFPGDVLGYGFPNFLEMVNLGSARIKRRWIVLKAVGAALSLGCGASVGREGPIAQIGGAIGSAVAQLRRLPADRAKVLIAAGAGAGIATTFNAPVGGVLFAQEIVLLGETELGNLTLLLVATVSAVVFSRAVTGNAAVFRDSGLCDAQLLGAVVVRRDGRADGRARAGYIHFFNATATAFRKTEGAAVGAARAGVAGRRPGRDSAAAEPRRRLPGDQPRDGRALRDRDDFRADRGQVLHLQRVARMRRARRRFRPDVLHRHHGGSDVSACDDSGAAYS